MIIQSAVYPKKQKKYLTQVCTDFNDKYETSRGVHLELTKVEGKTAKGATILVDGLKVTVKNPGAEIPGVKLFTPCRESALAIQTYKTSLQGTPAVSALPAYNPNATPGYDVNKSLYAV